MKPPINSSKFKCTASRHVDRKKGHELCCHWPYPVEQTISRFKVDHQDEWVADKITRSEGCLIVTGHWKSDFNWMVDVTISADPLLLELLLANNPHVDKIVNS